METTCSLEGHCLKPSAPAMMGATHLNHVLTFCESCCREQSRPAGVSEETTANPPALLSGKCSLLSKSSCFNPPSSAVLQATGALGSIAQLQKEAE